MKFLYLILSILFFQIVANAQTDYTPNYTIKDVAGNTDEFIIGMKFDKATTAATEIFNGTVNVMVPKDVTSLTITNLASGGSWSIANEVTNAQLISFAGATLAADWKFYAITILGVSKPGAHGAGTDVELIKVSLNGVTGNVKLLVPDASAGINSNSNTHTRSVLSTLDSALFGAGFDNTMDIDEDGPGGNAPDTNGGIQPSPSTPIPLGGVVPVTLIDFAAEAKGMDAHLTWSTASEINNKGFNVEYSLDGKDFERAGMVSGSGSTLSRCDYSFVHEGVGNIQKNGVYYRLTQVDYDGGMERMGVRYVVFPLSREKYTLYPNPVYSGQNMTLDIPQDGDISFTIYDLKGNVVKRYTDVSHRTISTEGLISGVYRLVIDHNYVSIPFTVVR